MSFLYVIFACSAVICEGLMKYYVTRECNGTKLIVANTIGGSLSGIVTKFNVISISCYTIGILIFVIFAVVLFVRLCCKVVGSSFSSEAFEDVLESLKSNHEYRNIYHFCLLIITPIQKIILKNVTIIGATYLVEFLGRNSQVYEEIHEDCKEKLWENIFIKAVIVNDGFVHLSIFLCFCSILIISILLIMHHALYVVHFQ